LQAGNRADRTNLFGHELLRHTPERRFKYGVGLFARRLRGNYDRHGKDNGYDGKFDPHPDSSIHEWLIKSADHCG